MRALFLVLPLLLGAPRAARPQLPALKPGTVVRVTRAVPACDSAVCAARVVGSVASAGPDTLLLSVLPGSVLPIPGALVTRIERSAQQPMAPLVGAGIGAATGAGVGLLIWAIGSGLRATVSCDPGKFCAGPGVEPLASDLLTGGGIGALVGVVAGSMVAMSSQGKRITVFPTAGGVAMRPSATPGGIAVGARLPL